MRPEGTPHTAPSRGIACVLAAPPPAHAGEIASSGDRGFPPQYWVGRQRGLDRVQGGILGGGGVGVLTGRIAGDRGVVAERARGVNVACAQEKHLGIDPFCRHFLTTVFGSNADTALSSQSVDHTSG